MDQAMMTSSPGEKSETSRVLTRFGLTTALGLIVAGVCIGVSQVFGAGLVLSSAVAGLLTWVICAGLAAWLVWKILTAADRLMHWWTAVASMHFATVAGGSVLLIMILDFHPAATLLSSFAVCSVFIYGGAWMVQAMRSKDIGSQSDESVHSERGTR